MLHPINHHHMQNQCSTDESEIIEVAVESSNHSTPPFCMFDGSQKVFTHTYVDAGAKFRYLRKYVGTVRAKSGKGTVRAVLAIAHAYAHALVEGADPTRALAFCKGETNEEVVGRIESEVLVRRRLLVSEKAILKRHITYAQVGIFTL